MRILKFISIVLISIVLLCVLLELSAFSYYAFTTCPKGESKKDYYFSELIYYFKNIKVTHDDLYINHYFRNSMGEEYKDSNPVLLFGGCYAYAHALKDEDTLQYMIADKTKRTVHNFSGDGWGPHNMLYQLKKDDFYSKIDKTPSAIVYLFMESESLYIYREIFPNEKQVFYTDTEDGLICSTFSSGNPFYGFFLKYMRSLYSDNYISNYDRTVLLIKHFVEARNEVKKHWGDVPFNILVYSYSPQSELEALESLDRLGFNVQYANLIAKDDLLQVKYQVSEHDMRPNKLAWQIVAPKFIENMKKN